MQATLILLTVFLLSASSFAQGRVSFQNTASTSYYIYTNNGVSSGLMSGANAYRIGLYASADANAEESALTLIALATNSSSLPGRFVGPSTLVLPGPYVAGSPMRFQLRGWSAAGGLSWDEALFNAANGSGSILLGKSELGNVTPTASPAPAAELFGTNPGQLTQGFVIGVPEPSSITLAALGAVACILCRRKRSAVRVQR